MKEEESSQHNKDDLLNFPIIHGEKELNCLGFGGLFLFFFFPYVLADLFYMLV